MERKHYMDEFESFLSEKADQYKLYPSDNVWENINKHLHPNRRWPYITAGLLLIGLSFVAERFISNGAGATASLEQKSASQSGSSNSSANSNAVSTPSTASISTITPSTNKIVNRKSSGTTEKKEAKVISLQDFLTAQNKSVERAQPADQISQSTLQSIAEPATPAVENAINADKELVFVNNPIATIDAGEVNKSNTETHPSNNSKLPSAIPLTEAIQKENQQLSAPAEDAELARPWMDNIVLRQSKRKQHNWAWQFYVSPTVSYRRLSGSIEPKNTPVPLSGVPYIANADYGKDINDAVSQHPAVGGEVGTSWIYNVNKSLRLKIGLQLNYTRYMVKAYKAAPQVAAYAASNSNGYSGYYADSIRLVSIYRNFNGYMPVELTNEYFQLAAPVGAEFRILGDRKIEWIVAGTLQPTYNLNNQAYLISTNFKNYAEEPTLIRRWNLATSFETFLSINTGNFKWQVGPQFRYQLLSSYKNKYPIREYLLDYGFKIGVSKTIR